MPKGVATGTGIGVFASCVQKLGSLVPQWGCR